MKRATIQDPVTGKLRHADYRVSKSAWLSPEHHEFVRKMAIRAQAVTGLDIRSAGKILTYFTVFYVDIETTFLKKSKSEFVSAQLLLYVNLSICIFHTVYKF